MLLCGPPFLAFRAQLFTGDVKFTAVLQVEDVCDVEGVFMRAVYLENKGLKCVKGQFEVHNDHDYAVVVRHNSPTLFQNGAENLDLRCVLLPALLGAGCKTRLESRIKQVSFMIWVCRYTCA